MSVPYKSHIHEYYDQMLTGKVTVGKWIRLLYDKIIAGLRDGLFTFDAGKANKAIRFIETFCHHCEGRNDLIKLELWQKSTVCLMFGVVDDEGLRVFREVFLVMGRKNGKSLFASAVLYNIIRLTEKSTPKPKKMTEKSPATRIQAKRHKFRQISSSSRSSAGT